jgi:nicotinamide mononucleotide transporter
MSRALEIAANSMNAVSILLAGRNSVHTWWTGIAGCSLFGWLFFETKLYADSTLQLFFIVTSALGWWAWLGGTHRRELPVRTTPARLLGLLAAGGLVVALGYAWLLHRFTDAFAPLPDSLVLAFSVIAQLLLMARRIETWWCWLLVNSIAVPLFASRGLFLTAALYTGFWLNAVVALRHWRRQLVLA